MSQYDLVVSGGRVIRPQSGPPARLDIAVAKGSIAAVDAHIPPGSADRTIDARGMLVVPRSDRHAHPSGVQRLPRDPRRVGVCPPSGVTTAVDMGSTGCFTFPWYRDRVLTDSPVRLYEFINILAIGLMGVGTRYDDYWDVDETIRIIEAHRQHILGIKVFGAHNMVRDAALDGLHAARLVADTVGVPICVHVGYAPPSLEADTRSAAAGRYCPRTASTDTNRAFSTTRAM